MRILSLCSGYGGLDLAIEEHFGAETVYWSDVDPSACAVMTERFPHAEPLGDLTQFGDTKFDCDVLSAGYPCQPFSLAGPRKGENDERHLWPYIRNTISVSRPRWVVLENVSGHLSLGATQVIADLASLRYDCRWQTIRASSAGAPHQRKRLFILGRNADADTNEQGSPESRSERSGWPTVGRGGDAATDSEGLEGHGAEHELREISGEESFGRDRSSASDPSRGFSGRRSGSMAGASGEVSRQRPDASGGDGDAFDARNTDRGRDEIIANSKGAEWGGKKHEDLETPTRSATEPRERISEIGWGRYEPAIRRWERVLGRAAPAPMIDERLSQHFVEWLMGIPAGHVCDIVESRSKALSVLGNGVVPQQARLALTLLEEGFNSRDSEVFGA